MARINRRNGRVARGEAPGPDHAAPDGGGAWAQLAVTGPACGPGRHAREEEDRAGARTIVAARA
ncbi:hypothetical protein BCEP27_20977 [Burkholderia cepacia]